MWTKDLVFVCEDGGRGEGMRTEGVCVCERESRGRVNGLQCGSGAGEDGRRWKGLEGRDVLLFCSLLLSNGD